MANQEEIQEPPSTAAGIEPSFTKALHLDMFEVREKKLSKGKFARIYSAKDRERGLEYALKVVRKSDIKYDRMEEQVRNSIKIHSNLDHPNILKFHGQFEHENKIYLVLELSQEGSLYDLMQKQGRFSEPQAAKFISQTARALRYLHDLNIFHRNINPENILLGSDGDVRVSGFIWSVLAPEGRASGLCGLLDYLAPELLQGAENYDSKVDVWCLGVMVFEFLVGEAPFNDSLAVTQRRIKNVEMEIPPFISSEARDLIQKILVADPQTRLSLEDVQQHPWILMHN